jgi:hypothetical protein
MLQLENGRFPGPALFFVLFLVVNHCHLAFTLPPRRGFRKASPILHALERNGMLSVSSAIARRPAPSRRPWLLLFFAALAAILGPAPARAQEPPYFVAYSHQLEEPDNLEIAMKSTAASPKNGNTFGSATLELEYGATGWWTTEVYLSGQTTANDSTVFNGFRWENRFRPLLREHAVNPLLYVEYENVNQADRSLLEITGHDSIADLIVPNDIGRAITERSLEMKLILSSNYRGWNFSENFITEKDLNEPEPWEFGYALGASRPLALAAGAKPCSFCRENLAAGLELYGGLGDTNGFGWRATSQYLGPTIAWSIPNGPTITFSPNFGLNDNSVGVIYRFKVSYEIQQFIHGFHRSSR